MTSIVISEIFGPTLQGEGPTAGHPAHFVRLGRCNLSCAWCDTPYTWDWSGKIGPPQDPGLMVKMTVDGVMERVTGARRVVVTGGEPLVQAGATAELCARLYALGVAVEVETNGTRVPHASGLPHRVQWNVSPKLAGSGLPLEDRRVPQALERFVGLGAAFKFVVCSPADVDEVAALQTEFKMRDVWVMPEGRTPEAIIDGLRWLAPYAVEHNWNLSSRLHVLVWRDVRGH